MSSGTTAYEAQDPASCVDVWSLLRQYEGLPRTRARCGGLARALGPLAVWMLKMRILEQAAEDQGFHHGKDWSHRLLQPPRLPDHPGCCWVVFVQPPESWGDLLREVLVLPLQWCAGLEDETRLPPALIATAKQVIAVVKPKVCWGLRFPRRPGFEYVDLRHVPVRCESAWAALAGSLIVADEGGRPDTAVWSTGGWSKESGIQSIGGLEAKLKLAGEFGARSFYVPASQADAARRWCSRHSPGMEIGLLRSDEGLAYREALADYLADLDVPPQLPVDCISPDYARWYLRLKSRSPSRAKRAYQEAIIGRVILAGRRSLHPPWSHPPQTLITIASDNPELVPIAAGILGVKRCVLLWSAEKQAQAQVASDLLNRYVPTCAMVRRQFERSERGPGCQFHDKLRDVLCQSDRSEFVFDLTPGDKLMSLSLVRAGTIIDGHAVDVIDGAVGR